ncbi:hypothetical protein TIFTF001_020886 [Ficus carica]|uniref:Cation/H+ exchanger transmembrane domain-containing protein n=1 Tax=Ficus carica TaxID=3494 RepID=A0AA88AJE9_FICCA|nr:hypothetical protein TIFTF001_020886 [Ficus carica]
MEITQDVTEFAKNLAKDHAQVVPISVFVAVLCLCLLVGHLLEENRWVNESITAIFIGLIAGGIILVVSKRKSSHILTFDEELFFIYLLPPIIFNAGFQVKKKQFFQNFLTIMLFGVVGVFISAAIITAGSWWLFPNLGFRGLSVRDYLAIGTIFSSTDTVCTLQVLHQDETPLLYSLVFGEGVVNDATSIVLFNAVQKIDVSRISALTLLRVIGDFFYLFLTSTALGIISGLLTAFVLKTLHSSIREIALMVLMAYLSYMLAETVLESQPGMHVFAMMSFVAETFIFLYVGMDAVDIEKWRMSKLILRTSLVICSTLILIISLARAAFVFPLSVLSNYTNRAHYETGSKITFKHMITIWWAGLMRGAVSIALAFEQFTFYGVTSDPINATMITTTIIVVLFSTVVFGLLTKPLINSLLLHPTLSDDVAQERSLNVAKDDLTLPLRSFEESAATSMLHAKESLSMLMERPVYIIHHYWRKFDNAYMRPIFGGPCNNQSPT